MPGWHSSEARDEVFNPSCENPDSTVAGDKPTSKSPLNRDKSSSYRLKKSIINLFYFNLRKNRVKRKENDILYETEMKINTLIKIYIIFIQLHYGVTITGNCYNKVDFHENDYSTSAEKTSDTHNICKILFTTFMKHLICQ